MTTPKTPARKKGPRMNRGLLAGIIVIVVMIGVALVIANPPGRATAAAQGPATVAVTRGKIIGSVAGNGTVAAEQTVDLAFQSTGSVKSVMVDAGDTVKAEDSLITLESDKATMDVPSPAAGNVAEVKVKVGDKVAEGTLILTLSTGVAGAAPAAPTATAPSAPVAAPSAAS